MIVQCPTCLTQYDIDTTQIGPEGQQYQCVSCNNLFYVPAPVTSPPMQQQPGFNEQNIQSPMNNQQQQGTGGTPFDSSNETLPLDSTPSANSTPKDVTTYPMQDPKPPEIDFTPPMTANPPTELPTGYIGEQSENQAGSSSFSPPTSNLEFPSDSIPPPPSNTPADFDPFSQGNVYQQPGQQRQAYAKSFSDFSDDQSLHLIEDSQKVEDDVNPTSLWNVRIGGKVERGLQLVQLKSWIRGGTLRETDEVQEPGGSWIQAFESDELDRFFRLKSKIHSEKIAKDLSSKKKKDDDIYCQNHSTDQAKWECVGCGRAWCEDCVQKRVFGGAKVNMCSKCGDRCLPVERKEDVPPFWHSLPEIFNYPLQKHGPIMIAFGSLIFFIAWMISLFTFGFGLFLSIALYGLLISYQLQIVRKSSKPSDSGYMPDFPDVTDNFWREMLLPYFQMLIAFILYFIVPIFLASYFMTKYNTFFIRVVDGKPEVNMTLASLIFFGFSLLGYYIFPMVIAVLAIHRTVAPAFNPILILRLIKRVVGSYTLYIIITTVTAIALSLINQLVTYLFTKLGFPGLITITATGFILFYMVAVLARMLGLFIRQVEDDLAWTSAGY